MAVNTALKLQPPSSLPRPKGSSYTPVAVKTWKRLKSDRARSLRQVRVSAGVRELVVLRPPPDDEPTGSTDWSSMDFENVYAAPSSRPAWKRLRNVACRP